MRCSSNKSSSNNVTKAESPRTEISNLKAQVGRLRQDLELQQRIVVDAAAELQALLKTKGDGDKVISELRARFARLEKSRRS